MKCPNCQSTELIDVQDQRFCLSCGLLIPPTAIAASAAAAAKAKLKRPVGRPRSKRLDVPADPAIQVHEVPGPEAAATNQSQPSKPFLNYPGSRWLRQLGHAGSYIYGLPPALWFGASIALAVYTYGLQSLRMWSLGTGHIRWLAIGLLVLIGALLLVSWAQSAIMYGLMRQADHRPLEPRHWASTAKSAFGPQLVVNLLTVGALAVVASGGIGLSNLVHLASGAPSWLVTTGVFASYALLIYLLFAALMLRRLVITLTVLRRLNLHQAIVTADGWLKAWPELITIELYEATLWLLGWLAVGVVGWWMRDAGKLQLVAVLGAASFLVAWLQLLRSAGWQQNLYHQLVEKQGLSKSNQTF